MSDPLYFRKVSDVPETVESPTGHVEDTRGRALRDLRISVTDRCNFRCVYCMPKEIFGRDYAFLPKASLLSFEEITRLTTIAAAHGIRKVRLTGGEPLLRKDIDKLVSMIKDVPTTDGTPLDVALTTNGSVLARKAQQLADAGLDRVTVSLDSVDEDTFRAMNDVDYSVRSVLDGIDAAHEAGLSPVKINMVVKKGMNDQDIVPMARHFKDTPYIVRFIEFMDVGTSNGWKLDEVVPSAEVIARINDEMPLEPASPNYSGEVAGRWRYTDGGGEIGVISSVTQAFCSTCTRARISADGKLFTCLFQAAGHDLRALLRGGCTDDEIATVMAHLWRARTDNYSERRGQETAKRQKIEMSYIGG
ncbi:GTP 3',8-cyclase MoaA [Spelaeicoccus albus]|uniref:GTP 3',8-cyclase n=1 Tax=Spelaeicoccus albus TaxID=1280376 RepID=A0A7Z0D4R8_9MICO|nr:GTP 3',8-cyclase MoaA [Spelaeicoccus albus]NYI68864.1 cyclic pyranopterin phosphate synthase [Spelaeicoccus albus]